MSFSRTPKKKHFIFVGDVMLKLWNNKWQHVTISLVTAKIELRFVSLEIGFPFFLLFVFFSLQLTISILSPSYSLVLEGKKMPLKLNSIQLDYVCMWCFRNTKINRFCFFSFVFRFNGTSVTLEIKPTDKLKRRCVYVSTDRQTRHL